MCLCWSAFIHFAKPNKFLIAQNPFQRNVIKVQDCIYHYPDKDVFLLGSSVTERIPAEKLGAEYVNWGLGGDTALTGAEIIRRLELKPKLILVECGLVNLKGTGPDLLRQIFSPVSIHLKSRLPLLEDRYQPLTLLHSLMRPVPNSTLASPVLFSEKHKEKALKFSQAKYARLLSEVQSQEYLKHLKLTLEILRSRGIQIVFFETPIHPSLLNTPRHIYSRKEFDRYFPGAEWPRITIEKHEDYLTYDGTHLDRPYAWKFAEFLRDQSRPFLDKKK
jgi:hypothetical protein